MLILRSPAEMTTLELDVRLGGALDVPHRSVAPPPAERYGFSDLVVADFDADGALDAVVMALEFEDFDGARNTYAEFLVAYGAGDGSFGRWTRLASGRDAQLFHNTTFAVGDLDGDERPDVVAGGPSHIGVLLFRNLSGQNLAEPVALDIEDHVERVALADLDGDGALDVIDAELGVSPSLGLWLATPGGEFGAFGPRARRPLDLRARDVHLVDLDSNGGLDIIATSADRSEIVVLSRAAPGSWAQTLTDFQDTALYVPPGGDHTLRIHQARQRVDRLAVRVRLEGNEIGGLSLALRTPRGDDIPLAAEIGPGPIWQGHFSTVSPDRSPDGAAALETAIGWHPTGDWSLIVDGGAGLGTAITDFAVMTWGPFAAPPPGTRADTPQPLPLPPDGVRRFATGATLAGTDTTAVTCAEADGAPDHWFELDLPAAGRIEALGVDADFDAAFELRAGPCAADGAALACRTRNAGRQPALDAPIPVDAGRHCLVVDGRRALVSGRFRAAITVCPPAGCP